MRLVTAGVKGQLARGSRQAIAPSRKDVVLNTYAGP
jgi:hypothetical protein